jgi:hypothetical protein
MYCFERDVQLKIQLINLRTQVLSSVNSFKKLSNPYEKGSFERLIKREANVLSYGPY